MSDNQRCMVTDECMFCGAGVDRDIDHPPGAMSENLVLVMLGPSGMGTVCAMCMAQVKREAQE